MLFHFGAEDSFIPLQAAERVCDFAQQRQGWECHVQRDAGRAFDNHDSAMFHRPEPVARAWERAWEITKEFLARNLA